MSQWQQPGTDEQVLTIITAIFDTWPAKKGTGEIVPLIWLRNLRKYPLLSIWEVLMRFADTPNTWRPDPGTFAQLVRSHAQVTESLQFNISKGQ